MSTSRWRILTRNKRRVVGCTITESILEAPGGSRRRFTATINGWRNWRLWEGDERDGSTALELVVKKVRSIRDRIEAGDESVFHEDVTVHP